MTGNYNQLFTGSIIVVGVLMQVLISETVNFNIKTHICCNGTVAERGENTQCCGNQAFDSTLVTCCGDQALSSKSCCYSFSGAHKAMDPLTHQCCGGELVEKPSKDTTLYGCCKNQLFNISTHLCCGGKLQDRALGNACCGDKIYNHSGQICCQKWDLAGGAQELEYSEILDRKGNGSCCGRVVYDPAEEVCCNDKILPKPESIAAGDAGCCEGQVMDYQNQLCCLSFGNASGDGKLHNKTGAGSTCCGTEVYDFHKEVCCNNTRLQKPKGVDKETYGACCGDMVMTSFEFQLCHDGRLVEREGFDMWVCGENNTMFNTTTHNCCFGKVLQNDGDEGCCYTSSRPYNKKTENCCGEDIVSLSEEDIKGMKFACCVPHTT